MDFERNKQFSVPSLDKVLLIPAGLPRYVEEIREKDNSLGPSRYVVVSKDTKGINADAPTKGY